MIGFALGATVVLQLHDEYGQSWDTALRILGRLVMNELGPLLGTLIVVARSSSAVANELANMRMHGEFRCLELHGIPCEHYLLLPRVAALAVAAMILSGCLALFALAGGVAFSSGWHAGYQLLQLDRMLLPAWIAVCLGKSLLFGLCTGLLTCAVGVLTPPLPTEIPKTASRAVFFGILALFLMDFLWSLVL